MGPGHFLVQLEILSKTYDTPKSYNKRNGMGVGENGWVKEDIEFLGCWVFSEKFLTFYTDQII